MTNENPNVPSDRRITRRQALRNGAIGAAGLLAGGRFVLDALGAPPIAPASQPASLPASQPASRPALAGKAKAVIQVWLWGGPSHMDTFDPKPDSGEAYTGPFKKPIPTTIPGVMICELLPLLAQQADKYSLIRSMTHGNNGHETAAYMVQTGWPDGGRVVHPTLGAIVSLFKGYDAGYTGLIPPYIVLTQPQGRFSEAGFLPAKYKPFATGGDPGQARFNVEGIVAPGISDERQRSRRDFLAKLNTLKGASGDDPQIAANDSAEKEAYDLILGDAGKVFDLSQESDDVRDRYGRTSFGASCLVARRLIQRGTPYVTINYDGWDTHKDNFSILRRKLPELDKGLSSLLVDLSDEGLLDSTIVWCCGEFGRTPKVDFQPPWDGGRGHWGNCFSALVAGGGFKGGHVVGASDEIAAEVKERPVYPWDLLASMCQLLGIDPQTQLSHPQGFTVPVMPSAQDVPKTGGLLKEIM